MIDSNTKSWKGGNGVNIFSDISKEKDLSGSLPLTKFNSFLDFLR